MALLSIIIPVYNGGAYLKPCLDSIFCQAEAQDCEVLLVNDGSTDSSLEIIQDYEHLYRNVRAIDKPNEGVSATRNRGLKEATGEYIFFMDADDILHPKSLAITLQNLSTLQPDILTWQFETFYTKPKFKVLENTESALKLDMSPQQAFNHLMKIGFAVSIYSKAIKRTIIENHILFDQSMTYGEDMFFSWKAFLNSDSFYYLQQPLYYYRQIKDSAVSRFHPNLYEKYRNAFDDIRTFIVNKGIGSNEMYKEVDYHFACRIPSLTLMESKAPYGHDRQKAHLGEVLNDERIRRALYNDERLTGRIYSLARAGKIEEMLKSARKNALKSKLLYPLKRLLK